MTGVAAIVLAAGAGSRFRAGDDDSKVLATYDGRSLLAHVLATVEGSRASPCLVVTGHAATAVAAALRDSAAIQVHAADHAKGMAYSLRAGIAALPETATGVIVLLADMPLVRSGTLDRLIATFEAMPQADVVVPVHAGGRGNPLLLARALFPEIATLTGDIGARRLLATPGRTIVECAVDDPGISADVDTRLALQRLRGSPPV